MSKIQHINEEGYVYFVTTCTYKKIRLFISDKLAMAVVDTILFGKSKNWFYLLGYVVMPNHLHLAIAPKGKKISEIMMSLKGYTSRKINWLAKRSGKVWQDGYIDFPMDRHAAIIQKINYIEQNPVRAGIVGDCTEYPYSSARNREILDWDYLPI